MKKSLIAFALLMAVAVPAANADQVSWLWHQCWAPWNLSTCGYLGGGVFQWGP